MKVFQVRVLSFSFLAAAVVCWLPLVTLAQSGEMQSPKSIFPEEITQREKSAPFVLLREPRPDTPLENEKLEEEENKAAELQVPVSSRDEIVKAFGNPNEKYLVRADDKAPLPFKGLMACLSIEDEECAAQYAKQYWQYRKDLSILTDRAVGIQKAAMVDQGIADEESLRTPEEIEAYRTFFAPDEPVEEETVIGVPFAGSLLQHLPKELAERFSSPELTRKAQQDLEYREEQDRAAVRKALIPVLNPSSSGKVDLLFFLNPRDETAHEQGRELERIYQRTRSDHALWFAALTINEAIPVYKRAFSSASESSFPLDHIESLVQDLEITRSPTIIFRLPGSTRVYKETGFRAGVFIDELLSILKGQVQS